MEKQNKTNPNRRLRHQRDLRGWTQAMLAEKIGTTIVNISRWENGSNPGPYFRRKLCEIFDKDANELGLIDEEPEDAGESASFLSSFNKNSISPGMAPPPPNQPIRPSMKGNLKAGAIGHQNAVHHASQQAMNQVNSEQTAVPWPATVPDEPYYPLPGREKDLEHLLAILQAPQGPPVITIDGLGGLGKTAMAVELSRRALRLGLFGCVVGDSAQQELFTGGEIVHLNEAKLDFDFLLDSIARQLGRWELLTYKTAEKRAVIGQLLRQQGYIVLVDNLETTENARALVAHLRGLLGVSRAIVTSRIKVPHDFVHVHSLQGLVLEDTLFFLQEDLELHGGRQLLNAPEEKLVEIHTITGGAPLALKLVAAQSRFLDLDIVLRQLRQAGSKLYSFIFRQSWQQLSPTAQKILIYIGTTVVTTVGWEELINVGIAGDEEQLIEAIDQLVAYSLLEVSSTLNHIRYGAHQLTRQFVNSELPVIWREQGLL